MSERFHTHGGVELCYETFGEPTDPAMLLIAGLGMQMIAWNDDLCHELTTRGFYVIRFDNRDTGRSTHFDHVPPPRTVRLATRRPRPIAYTLAEMAADATGLLEHLDVDTAHVNGVSMGAMIAQTLAARHPEQVRSLVSIMSSTGSLRCGQAAPSVLPLLLRPLPADSDARIERLVTTLERIASRGFEPDHQWIRTIAKRSCERGDDRAGTLRQLAAIIASGNRTAELRTITAPTLVIHGDADRVIAPSGGVATARAIAGAAHLSIKGMGHDLPRPLWPMILDAIADHANRADRRDRSARAVSGSDNAAGRAGRAATSVAGYEPAARSQR